MRLIILMIFAITLTSCATEVENNKGEKFPFSMSTSTQDKPSPTVLARLFNDTSEHRSVSINATRKWLEGRSFPHQDNLVRLADIFEVSLASLRFGESDLEKADDYTLSKSEYRLIIAFRKMSSARREIFLSQTEV